MSIFYAFSNVIFLFLPHTMACENFHTCIFLNAIKYIGIIEGKLEERKTKRQKEKKQGDENLRKNLNIDKLWW